MVSVTSIFECIPLLDAYDAHSLVVVDEGLFVEEAFGFRVEASHHAVCVVFVAFVVVYAFDAVCEYPSDFLEDW